METEHGDFEQWEIVLDSLAKLMASVGIIRRCMTAVIASHPDPVRMRSAWEARRLDWVDDEMAEPLSQIPAYQETVLSVLRGLSEEIDRAADAV